MTDVAQNWFLTWGEGESEDAGKSFVLQVEISGLVFRDVLSDGINSYVLVERYESGSNGRWKMIGQTAVVKDEESPKYPESFRVFYQQHTDLSNDFLRVTCVNRRDALGHTDVIGTVSISVYELVRTFGTRVRVELLSRKRKDERVVGRVTLVGEGLPSQSPRGGDNLFKFKIACQAPRKSEVRYGMPRPFLVISRERDDGTWSTVWRTPIAKRQSRMSLNRSAFLFKEFHLRQSEMVLGKRPQRRILFALLHHGKKGDPHIELGEAITSADELLNDLEADSSTDLLLNGEVIGMSSQNNLALMSL